MSKLDSLQPVLTQLAQHAAALDRQRGEQHQPLFDERLFRCKARLLVPCTEEAQSTFDTIVREEQAKLLTAGRAEYLTERLLSQISAIQRELSTPDIRRQAPRHPHHFRKPINELYQELAQHQEWERRLMEMVRAKEQALATAPSFQQQAAQQALIATEQRLKRCQEAKIKLEKQITYREKHQ